jgi:metal-responsive CopG/Arc/MetJ family transcriptional regulator
VEILSISIDKEALKELEGIQKRLGFKSRSKMLRSAIFSLLKDYEGLESLSGNVDSIFVITYSEGEKNHVSDVLHKYENMIKTELHQHHMGTCIDVLHVGGAAKMIRDFYGVLKRNKCIYSVTYSLIKETKKGKA